jgi:RNase P subunit RPR2
MKCSNCDAEIDDMLNALVVTRGPGRAQVAVICKTCETGVLTMKIVLSRRDEKSEFGFEGYLPVSSVK